ncbi:unnamed protein product [Effrenium voratum]|nr:unnamed protein product [Effrenium voratum]
MLPARAARGILSARRLTPLKRHYWARKNPRRGYIAQLPDWRDYLPETIAARLLYRLERWVGQKQTLYPEHLDFCNSGGKFGVPIPAPELVRNGFPKGCWEWQMHLYGAALYWHLATTAGAAVADADEEMLKHKRVLEVSCMRGGGARYLAEVAQVASYVATDSRAENIEICRERHKVRPSEILRYEQVAPEDLAARFGSGAFDVLLCVEDGADFEGKAAFARSCAEVLRSEGLLLLCDAFESQQLRELTAALEAAHFAVEVCVDMGKWVRATGLAPVQLGETHGTGGIAPCTYVRILARKQCNPGMEDGCMPELGLAFRRRLPVFQVSCTAPRKSTESDGRVPQRATEATEEAMAGYLQPEHFETLRAFENLEGWNDREVCDAFHKMWEIFVGYDNSVATEYFLLDHPHLIERVLKYSRLDVLPLDVPAKDFGEFTERYNFFKCDVSASDDAVVRNGQLSFTSYSYAAVYIPPLNFGSLREMTVSFYFSIDNLGEDMSVTKRFGFRLGQLEVYFVPDTDITDIGQFRRCYTHVAGADPQVEYLDQAAFLEGELMRVVFQIHQDHMSTMHLCKTTGSAAFSKDVELNRLGFCNAASRATDFLGIFADGGDEKMFRIESLSLLQYEEDPQSTRLIPVWPELKFRAERLLWMVMEGCNREYTGTVSFGADSRAKAIACIFTTLVHLTQSSVRTRGMKAISSILKSIDLLILRPEDKGALMPHLGKLVRLFDFLVSLEMSDQYLWEQACVVHVLGHCVAGDEHRSAELLQFDNSMFSVGLQNCLSADSRRAHKENLIARSETGSTEVQPTIRLQNAALFCLSALGLPQSSAELQEKGCVLEKRERPIGQLHHHDAERLLRILGTHDASNDHPAVFPSYTLMFVAAVKRELCVSAKAAVFQALVVNESNLPNVYVSLEDFTVCVQVRTKSGRLESVQSTLRLIDQVMPVTVTVVVDGLLVFLYLNGREGLDQPKRLSDYAAEVQAGEISCGRSNKAVEALEHGLVKKEEDPVLSGALLLLRFYPRAMVAYEVESKMQVARSQAAKALKKRGGKEEIPLTVFNIIEVTQLVIQFTYVQLNDESLAAMGHKKAGLQEVLDPDTIMWMVLALGTAAMYLPHQHPKFLELIKQPFVKVMQMIAGIIDGNAKDLSNYEQAFIAACTVYVAFVLASPRGKNILQDDLAAKLIIKMNGYSDSPIDFSDYVIKNCQSISSRVAVLILRAKQESPATLALVLDAVISRIVNEDGVIFKEDLQEFLVDQGLGAVIQVLDFVGRGLLDIERRERDRKKGDTKRLTQAESEEQARQEKAERLALEQVGNLAARIHRQLFLQLHHVMDEVIHGLPLDEVSMLALVKMIGTVLEVPQVIFMPSSSLHAEKMQDIEVAEGMPFECWRSVWELSCDKLRVWTEKFYPMSLRTYGEVSTLLEDLQEQVCVRDKKHIGSPRLEIGALTQSNKAWIHFQSSQPKMMTDTEVRVLAVHEPPVEVPVKKSGHKYCAEPSRLVAFANAVLCNNRFKDEVYANVVVILAELNLPELYTSMVPLLVQTALQSDWLCRLVSHELLHNVLYPDKHLLPLLYEAVLSSATPLQTRYTLLELCRRIAHSSFTPLDGFEEFLQVLRSRAPPELHAEGKVSIRDASGIKPAHDATARFLNTLFWRLPQDTIELTTRPRGQSSEEYWMLPRLLDALGHPDDEAVEDLLQVLLPLASPVQVVKKEDLEEEFAHLVFVPQHTRPRERETPAERLLREAANMISDGERISVLVYLLRLLRPRFLRRALDWKASVRDFVLDLILNERVLTELTTAMGIADEFWVVVVQVLESGGLPGQRWVAQTLRWLVRAAEQEAPQEGDTDKASDLRLVRSACSPKILVPLVMHLSQGALASASSAAKRMLGALEQVPDSLLSLLRHLPTTEQNSLLTDSLRRLLDSSKILRTKGQPQAADAVATFAARTVLTYLSTGLVTELLKRYPQDCSLERIADDGSKIYTALPFEMPGAISVKVMWESKKAMNTDILLTPTGQEEAMSLELDDAARVLLSTRNAGEVVKVAFKPGFAKISQGRIFCGFDRASSKGEGKEEFVLKALPVFVFRSISRHSINELLVNSHFEDIMKMLLPSPEHNATAIRGVPLAVVQACNWCYSVLAKELESDEKLEGLNPETVPVFPFLRLVLDIIHRLEAARPGEPELALLEEQARVAGETMLTFSRSMVFREAMLGGPDWEHVPVFLDIMKRRRREEWVRTVSYVLAQLLGVTDDKMQVRRQKLEIATAATTAKAAKMEIQTVEQVLEETVPSPFAALLFYVSAATKEGVLKAVHAKVLCHVADLYALLLAEGWQPTFQETLCRPRDLMEAQRAGRIPL